MRAHRAHRAVSGSAWRREAERFPASVRDTKAQQRALTAEKVCLGNQGHLSSKPHGVTT